MPDNWDFLDDDENDDKSVGDMGLGDFDPKLFDDDGDSSQSSDILDVDDSDEPSSSGYDDVSIEPIPDDNGSTLARNDDDSDDTFGIIDPQDNMSTNRAQADAEDGMLDFSQYENDSPDSDANGSDAEPPVQQTVPSQDGHRQYTVPDAPPVPLGQPQPAPVVQPQPQTQQQPQPQTTSTPPVQQQVPQQFRQQYPTPPMNGEQQMNATYTPQQSSTPSPTGNGTGNDAYDNRNDWNRKPLQQSQYAMDGTSSYGTVPQSSKTQVHSNLSDIMPRRLDVETIGKIIRIIDDYRHFDKKNQEYVTAFMSEVNRIGKSDVTIDGTEASVVKSIIEVDPDIRNGVVELMRSKKLMGAERAFHLMELSAHELNNVNIILEMMSLNDGPLDVSDNLSSIRTASKKLDDILEHEFGTEQKMTLTPIFKILTDAHKIMNGENQA